MNEGPTTVGSIVGRVKLDVTQWLADKAKVKEDAREIGALRPTVKVDADVAGAIARLDGAVIATDKVVAARKRLDTAERQAANAASTAYIANQRLEAVMDKRGRTALQVEAATEALARADRNAAAAEERLIVANEALAKAEKDARQEAVKLAAAQVAGAGATDAATRATIRANEANRTHVTRIGLIATAIAILIPLLIPVAGLAVGIAGALTMMGVAGVLAVLGIRNEMARGTATGDAYGKGLRSLKGNLDDLSRTAAVNMLSSFQRVVRETNADLPMLNRQVGYFTGLLGRSGANLFSGSIQGLRVLEPLLLTVGVYLEGLTKKFQNWTGNGGLERFGNWAMSVLPQAERLIGALSAAVMHLLVALEPLGMIGVAVLTGISDAINGTPVEVLGALIGAVLWGTLAFKAWGFIAPMLAGIATQMGAVGAATTIATGPIGWIIAAAAGLAAIIAVVTMNTQSATAAIATYTLAVQADTGAIGDNVKATAAKKLLDEGAYDLAKKLGISTRLVTDAVLGNADAMKQLRVELEMGELGSKKLQKQLDKTGMTEYDFSVATLHLGNIIKDQSGGIQGAVEDYQILHEALGDVTDATTAQGNAILTSAGLAGLSQSAYNSATAAQKQSADQLATTTLQMQLQNDAAGLLRGALDLLNGVSLDVYSAQTGLASANNSLRDSFTANGLAIDGTTKAAVANQQALQAQVQAAQRVAEAIGQQTGSSVAAIQSYKDSKAALEAQLVAQGMLTPAVQEYIDKLYDIANLKVPPTKLDVDAAGAIDLMTRLKALIDELRKPVSISVTGSSTIGRGLQAFAGGGTVRGPGSSKSDSVLILASDGEEVTPEPQATRYRALLKAIASDNLAGITRAAGVVQSSTNHPAAPIEQPPSSPPPAASGPMTISGTLDLGNGLVGVVRGVLTGELNRAYAAKVGR